VHRRHPPSKAQPDLLRARQKIGKYRILGRIASGPLADVFRAYDTIQKQRVALKIPKADAYSGHEEFLHEVQVATKLQHPNILTVLNASYIDDHFVIAMELGEESLADRIERRISTARALDLAGQAIAALAHAHEYKIIHCDIKPENYILFPGNQLKLCDFGFAKISLRTLKASGSGTIDYIAPEQAMGRPKFQSDVFSLGLVLYRLLSGKLPEWPFAWPMVGHERLTTKVRPELVEMLRKAIQLDPANRYRDAVQMMSAFEQLQSHARRQKRSRARADRKVGTTWRRMQWREFQRQYKKILDTRHQCRHCEGPVSESMQACPWCGSERNRFDDRSQLSHICHHCHRGVAPDWHYCPWCYRPGFIPQEPNGIKPDYKTKCHHCGGKMTNFMKYCPWCHKKPKKPWHLRPFPEICTACGNSVDTNYWIYCPWCTAKLV